MNADHGQARAFESVSTWRAEAPSTATAVRRHLHRADRRHHFAFRPEYNDFWDYRIWLEVSPELALQPGIERDTELEGVDEARRLHRDRYHVAVSIYVDEVAPRSLADVTIDNSDFEAPRIIPTGPHLQANSPPASLCLGTRSSDDRVSAPGRWVITYESTTMEVTGVGSDGSNDPVR